MLIEIRSINFIAMLFCGTFGYFFSLNANVTHKPTLASQRKIDCLLNNEIKKKSRECLTIVKENISLKLFVHCPRLVARKKNKNKTSLKKLLDFMLLQFFVSNCFFYNKVLALAHFYLDRKKNVVVKKDLRLVIGELLMAICKCMHE